MDRRRFLQTAAATTLMTSLDKKFAHAAQSGTVPMRTLGRSGEKVSMVGIGGYHIGMQDEAESLRIIRTGLDQLPRQLLGLQRRRERDPDGQSLA